MKIVIECRGGVIQNVYSDDPSDVDVEVYDFDEENSNEEEFEEITAELDSIW